MAEGIGDQAVERLGSRSADPAASLGLWSWRPFGDPDGRGFERSWRYVDVAAVEAFRAPEYDHRTEAERLGAVASALAASGITYAYEPPIRFGSETQLLRDPERVLEYRQATCVEMSLVTAGACLRAGLHPWIVFGWTKGVGAHAWVVVDIGTTMTFPAHSFEPRTSSDAEVVALEHSRRRSFPTRPLETEVDLERRVRDEPDRYRVVDPARLCLGYSGGDHFTVVVEDGLELFHSWQQKRVCDLVWWHPALVVPAPGRRRRTDAAATGAAVELNNLWMTEQTDLAGRETELENLTNYFSAELERGEGRRPHVISGEPGMGKSALAQEVASRLSQNYAVVWWIDADGSLKIRTGLRELARRLGIESARTGVAPEAADEEPHRFLNDLRDHLAALDGRVLVILDNVDDAFLKRELPATTLRYLPALNCDILITSQSSDWRPVVGGETPLKGLDAASGVELICRDSERPELVDDPNVGAICRVFSGRPLFLKPIARLIRYGEDPASFLDRLDLSTEDALEVLPDMEGFEPLWRDTYRMAVERADAATPGSRHLLSVLSMLSPEPIPFDLVRAITEVTPGAGEARTIKALRTLVDRNLILEVREGETHSSRFTVHRVVAALVRMDAFVQAEWATDLTIAAQAVALAIPTRDVIRRAAGRERMTALAPHVEAITDRALEHLNSAPGAWADPAAEASSLLGLYRRTLSEWAASQEAHEKAVVLSGTGVPPGHCALRQVRLANVMRQRGDFDAAECLLDEALPALEANADVRDYAWALTVRSRILRVRRDSATVEALEPLAEATRLLKRYEQDPDPNTVRQRSELHGYASVLHRQLSEYTLAENEATEGLRLITGGLTPTEVLDREDVPQEVLVATHLRALGGVWRVRGQFELALRAHRRALQIFELIHGPDHTDVGRALDSLGRVQREWGDLDGAVESFRRAADISDRRFGPNYPHAGTAAVNLALVHLETGDLTAATIHANAGLDVYRRFYAESYDDRAGGQIRNEATAWALFVRADVLAAMGDLGHAARDHESVLRWRQVRFPHPNALTASSCFALGDVLLLQDQAAAGLRRHRESYAIRMRVFEERPDYWLAQSQARLGELTKDRELLTLAFKTFSTQLRPGHRRTVEVEAAIARLADDG